MTDATFDDRNGFIWMDGELKPWREANVHILTHGLHYASSVFEGARAYGGHIYALSAHSQRLIASANIMGFPLPWSVEEIDEACRQTLAANGLTNAYVRPVAWRGSEQMGVSAQKTKAHLAVATWEWGAYFGPEARKKGLRYGIDLKHVPMVADTLRDLQAAAAAGCEPHLVRSGRAAALDADAVQALADQVPGTRVHDDLSAFADHLLGRGTANP